MSSSIEPKIWWPMPNANSFRPKDGSLRDGSSKAKQISFRLEGEYVAKLDERASQTGQSAGVMARQLVIEALEREVYAIPSDPVLRLMIARLRCDILTSVMVLLVDAGKADDPEEARAFILGQFGADALDPPERQGALA